jgi:hypothetical protein
MQKPNPDFIFKNETIGVEKHGALHNTRKHLESIYPN